MALDGPGNVTLAEMAEFERRLAELELQINSKAPANSQIDPDTALLLGQGVPPITGMTLVSKVAAITIGWSPSPITDLKRYEVQIATDTAFTADVTTRFTRETTFTWPEAADAETTYYFRVRARNTAENVGLYSAVLNGTTGEIQTADIADAAVTTALIAPDATLQIAHTTVADTTVTTTSYVLQASVTIDVSSQAQAIYIWCGWRAGQASLLRDLDWVLRRDSTDLLGSIVKHNHIDMEDYTDATWPDTSFTAGEGEVTYGIFMKVDGGTSTITIYDLSLSAIEFKR